MRLLKPRKIAATLLAVTTASLWTLHAHAECWAETREQWATDAGTASAGPGGLYADLKAVEAWLKSDPALAAIAGYRPQANIYLGLSGEEGSPAQAEVMVGLHRRDVWLEGCALDQEAADYFLQAAIYIQINSASDLVNLAQSRSDFPLASMDLPVTTGANQGRPIYAGTVLAFAPAGEAVLLPYTVGDHLAEYRAFFTGLMDQGFADFAKPEIAVIDRHRSGLSAAQLSAQAGFSNDMGAETLWTYGRASDPGAIARVYVNPGLLSGVTDRHAVRLITLRIAFPQDEHDDPARAALTDWLQSADFSILASLVK